MESQSSQPFGDALRELMRDRSLTYRSLADATREVDGRGLTHAHINMLANGHDKPSMRAMELVATACGTAPEYFAEYRLAQASRPSRTSALGVGPGGEGPPGPRTSNSRIPVPADT
jgi:transcriptional regulator with XRE-family HTH domain